MLFKYRNLHTTSDNKNCLCARTMEIIEHGSVYVPSHEELNDPYERLLHVVPLRAFSDEEEELSNNRHIENISKIDPDSGEFLKLLTEFRCGIIEDTNDLANATIDIFSSGIYSLSETNDSIIMWSHYGQNHEGICIGFDKEDLKKTKNLVKVKYVKNTPTYCFDKNNRVTEKYFYKHKYYQWSYEKEWRLILPYHKSQCMHFPAKIKAIFFGAKVNSDLMNACIEKTPSEISIFRFSLSNKDFKLHSEQILR